jgi:hypothetical protein
MIAEAELTSRRNADVAQPAAWDCSIQTDAIPEYSGFGTAIAY